MHEHGTEVTRLSRRQAVVRTGTLAAGVLSATVAGFPSGARGADASAPGPAKPPEFRLSLNTATIRGQKLWIVREIEIASKAGDTSIET